MLQDYFSGALRQNELLGINSPDFTSRTVLDQAIISYKAIKLLDRDDLDLNHPNNSPEEACRVEQ
jgi:hypothetical protein